MAQGRLPDGLAAGAWTRFRGEELHRQTRHHNGKHEVRGQRACRIRPNQADLELTSIFRRNSSQSETLVAPGSEKV